ncbi:MAG: polysaccharide deacetylase family protein, partial [Saezia sp.]
MSGISIFMYHQVGKFAPMQTHRASYCDVDTFRSHMQALKWLGVKVLSMTELVAALSGQTPMPKRAAVLTFDDGCANFLEYGLPILEEFGYPSIVYAVSDLVGTNAAWLAADNHPTPALMTYAQLREIKARGVEVASHAKSHTRLAPLSSLQQLDELVSSKARLQDELGAEVMHVCYPYGSYNQHTLDAAKQAGYLTGMTCVRGAATPEFDLLELPRKAISYGDNILGFIWKLYAKNEPKEALLAKK